MAESLISSPEAPLLGELSAKQTERLYEGKRHLYNQKSPRHDAERAGGLAIWRWRGHAVNSASGDG